jgi:hypothetical protein
MSVEIKLTDLKFKAKLSDLKTFKDKVMPQLYAEFKKDTPIDTGNARNNTFLNGNKIEATYPYAERLDEGYSKQAPTGMTQPTLEYAKKLIPQVLKQLGKK